jgi:hypothetical protein
MVVKESPKFLFNWFQKYECLINGYINQLDQNLKRGGKQHAFRNNKDKDAF